MGFVGWAAGASLRDTVKSSVIWERLGIEPLLIKHRTEAVEVV